MDRYSVAGHKVEMTVPETSTAGGVQSLQHIRLVPPHAAGRTYVVGNANRVTQSAEVRTLEYLDQVSLDRFGERTGFSPAEYDACMAAAMDFLQKFGLNVVRATRAESVRPPPVVVQQPSGFSPLAVFVIVIWSCVVLALGLAIGMTKSGARFGH
jgi:hypothetical protein